MKKIFIIIATVFIFTSCFLNIGTWKNDVCRPKHPNFKLQKAPFKETNLINFSKAYICDDEFRRCGLGFFPDGRMIGFATNDNSGLIALKKEDIKGLNWNNARTIGYWRVEDNRIKTECFACSEGGYYARKEGKIKGDTIIFYQNFYMLTGKEVREERYILSDMSFE
ncbi:MAG: hypothetical protein H6Q25_1360 [Bacteroidetes bacterium]|nr:hypothetical protein [Bacteroidota bacterium]